MQYVFVLGASDPEMSEIERVVREAGHEVRHAMMYQSRVRAETAYLATGINQPLPLQAKRVFVECSVRGLRSDVVIDHHRPGDPGYEAAPQDYLQGSSLGQVLQLLGIEPTPLQRLIAAADHCPSQAYRGECPGVCPKELRAWRTTTRAERRGISQEEMERAIEKSREFLLNKAERVDFKGQQFPWVPDRSDVEVSEASARFGIPFMYAEPPRAGKVKLGIVGAEPSVIEAWMQECGLMQVYGNPHRGYAGGYAPA